MHLATRERMRCFLFLVLLAGCVDPFAPRRGLPDDDDDRPDAGPRPRPDATTPDPEPDAPPAARLRVFASSLAYPAPFQQTIPSATPQRAADSICQSLADAAQLRGTFRAWLSTADGPAIDRVDTNGGWVRMDGVLAFSNHKALEAKPQVPIDLDERGQPLSGTALVWTGSAIGGQPTTTTCHDWSSNGAIVGTVGLASSIDDWTARGTSACNSDARLYCFEQ